MRIKYRLKCGNCGKEAYDNEYDPSKLVECPVCSDSFATGIMVVIQFFTEDDDGLSS